LPESLKKYIGDRQKNRQLPSYRNKASAKLRLGIYYLRKSVFLIFLNNHLTDYYTMTYCLKRKNEKRFFSFQSMPNLNFAELIQTHKWVAFAWTCFSGWKKVQPSRRLAEI